MIVFKAIGVFLVGMGSFVGVLSLQVDSPFAWVGVFVGMLSIGLGLLIAPTK